MNTIASEYFRSVVITVFDDYFQNLGAIRESADRLDRVRFSTDDWFVEILYLPEDGPDYVPRVEIGCSKEQFADPRRNRVDIMHTAPRDSEEYQYNLRWRYNTREKLEVVLTNVRDRIFDRFALPFVRDPKRLKTLLKERYDAVESEWKKEIDGHNDSIWRRNAETAFKSKDFEKAAELYDRIPEQRRTKIDETRLRIAQARK